MKCVRSSSVSTFSHIIIMIVLLLLAGAAASCFAQCPDTFERHGSNCYKVVAIKANWIDSREYCKLFGGELLRIETADEQNVIDGILTRIHGSTTMEDFWINGGDMLSENEFRWFYEDGQSKVIHPSDYTNFETSQPDNGGSIEHCLEIRYKGHSAPWNDRQCDAERFFICESMTVTNSEIVG